MFGITQMKGYTLQSETDAYSDLFFLNQNVCKQFKLKQFTKHEDVRIVKTNLLLATKNINAYLYSNTMVSFRYVNILSKTYFVDEQIINDNLIDSSGVIGKLSKFLYNIKEFLFDSLTDEDEVIMKFIISDSSYSFKWPIETVMQYNKDGKLFANINVFDGFRNILDTGRMFIPDKLWSGIKFGGRAKVKLTGNEFDFSLIKGKMILPLSVDLACILKSIISSDESLLESEISLLNLSSYGKYYTFSDCNCDNRNVIDVELLVRDGDSTNVENISLLSSDLNKYIVGTNKINNILNKCEEINNLFEMSVNNTVKDTGYFSSSKWKLLDKFSSRNNILNDLLNNNMLLLYELPIKSRPKFPLRYILYSNKEYDYLKFAEYEEKDLKDVIRAVMAFNNKTTAYIKSIVDKYAEDGSRNPLNTIDSDNDNKIDGTLAGDVNRIIKMVLD